MKHLRIFSFLLLGLASFSLQGIDYPKVSKKNFSLGEKFTYLVHYGFIHGGEAVVQMDNKIYSVNNRPCYKVEINGKTTGLVRFTFKVDDTWGSYIDTTAVVPQRSYRNIKENNYRKDEMVYIDHSSQQANVRYKVGEESEKSEYIKIPKYAQDMVSGYYFLRTIDFANMNAKDTIKIDGFFENKVYKMNIVYLGKEKLRTKFGVLKSIVLQPVMPNNDLFSGKNAIKFWISDDNNRVPLKIRAAMFVGALELDLIAHEGMKENFALYHK